MNNINAIVIEMLKADFFLLIWIWTKKKSKTVEKNVVFVFSYPLFNKKNCLLYLFYFLLYFNYL